MFSSFSKKSGEDWYGADRDPELSRFGMVVPFRIRFSQIRVQKLHCIFVVRERASVI